MLKKKIAIIISIIMFAGVFVPISVQAESKKISGPSIDSVCFRGFDKKKGYYTKMFVKCYEKKRASNYIFQISSSKNFKSYKKMNKLINSGSFTNGKYRENKTYYVRAKAYVKVGSRSAWTDYGKILKVTPRTSGVAS